MACALETTSFSAVFAATVLPSISATSTFRTASICPTHSPSSVFFNAATFAGFEAATLLVAAIFISWADAATGTARRPRERTTNFIEASSGVEGMDASIRFAALYSSLSHNYRMLAGAGLPGYPDGHGTGTWRDPAGA